MHEVKLGLRDILHKDLGGVTLADGSSSPAGLECNSFSPVPSSAVPLETGLIGSRLKEDTLDAVPIPPATVHPHMTPGKFPMLPACTFVPVDTEEVPEVPVDSTVSSVRASARFQLFSHAPEREKCITVKSFCEEGVKAASLWNEVSPSWQTGETNSVEASSGYEALQPCPSEWKGLEATPLPFREDVVRNVLDEELVGDSDEDCCSECEYLADNSLLKASTPGLNYRSEPALTEKHGGYLPWGVTVLGRLVEETWIMVDEGFYLPTFLSGKRVLVRVRRRLADEQITCTCAPHIEYPIDLQGSLRELTLEPDDIGFQRIVPRQKRSTVMCWS